MLVEAKLQLCLRDYNRYNLLVGANFPFLYIYGVFADTTLLIKLCH